MEELSQYLPEILKTIVDVKGSFISHQIRAWKPLLKFFDYLAAFASILEGFKLAQGKINSGVTDPKQIFAQSHEEVVAAWQGFEAKRKTMTYLPYKY